MKALAIAAILGLVIAGHAAAAPAKTVPTHGPQVASLRQGFDASLIDYGSARFREVRISTDGVAVCGFVNSKNRMGGYSGWAQFYAIALPSSPAIITLATDESNESVVADMCAKVEDKWAPGDLSDRLAPKP